MDWRRFWPALRVWQACYGSIPGDLRHAWS
jgi:hypothetical protein